MVLQRSKYKGTLDKAKGVLRENTYTVKIKGKTYRRIIPSRSFYVHQWNWDSAIHAMATVFFDENLAFDEIRSLISGQWTNGMIPHIVFNPEEKLYFPDPEFWGTDKFAFSSGITQPPVLAIAILHVYKKAKNRRKAKEFLLEVLPKLLKYHNYLKKYRDPEGSGLLTLVHPWESGTDNSPRFDAYLSKINIKEIPSDVIQTVRKYRTDIKVGVKETRPRDEDYLRYIYLIDLYKKWGWDYKTIVKRSPFAIKDVFFSSIWAASNMALSQLIELSDSKSKASYFKNLAAQSKRAISESFNIKEPTIALFAPIFAGVESENKLDTIAKILITPKKFWSKFPVPSVSLDSLDFDSTRYWRGPSWPIINMFLIDGLSSKPTIRKNLLEKTMTLIKKNGFFECYDPKTGSPAGFPNFSWTAAIFIYLYYKYYL